MARRGWALVGVLSVLLATVLASPASGQVATFSIGITIQGPSSVTAGDTNVAGGLALVNNSSGVGPVTLTSITYHPSCADFALACTAPEPGVFTLSPAATGAAGTGCAGVTFSAAPDGSGRYTLTPSAPIVLATGGNCTISFTFNVLRVPTTDAQVATPGVQTVRSAIITGTATATAGGGTVNGTPAQPVPAAPVAVGDRVNTPGSGAVQARLKSAQDGW